MNMKEVSSIQEKRVANLLGLDVVRGSGAVDFHKGDVIGEDYFIECKTKLDISKSHSLKKEWFEKLKRQAFESGKYYFGLAFDFGDGEDFVAIPISQLAELLTYKEEVENLTLDLKEMQEQLEGII